MKITFLVGARNHLAIFFVLAESIKKIQLNAEFCFDFFRGVNEVEKVNEEGYSARIINENECKIHKSEHWNMAEFALSYVDSLDADKIVVPYEFGFLFFVIHFAKQKKITSIHVQHAMWGKGKFFAEFFESEAEDIKSIIPESKWNKRRIKSTFLNSLGFLGKLYPYQIKRALIAFDLLNRHEKVYPLSTDYFLAPNYEYKKQVRLERPNYPQNKVVVSGVLKKGLRDRQYSRGNLAEKFKLDINKNWYTYLFAAFENYPKRYTLKQSTIEALKEFLEVITEIDNNAEVLVMIHPVTPVSLNELIKDYSILRPLYAIDEHFDVYRESKMICGVKSTALLEASVCEVPVIRQNYILQGEYDQIQKESNAIYFAETSTDLKRIIHEILKGTIVNKVLNQKKIADSIFTPIQISFLSEIFANNHKKNEK